jgi:hypothetical protein
MNARAKFVAVFCFAALAAGFSRSADAQARIAWSAPIEIARGSGVQGPWHQNDSNYDYVDDPSVALSPDGTALVVWVDQRRKDVLFQAYGRGGKPRFERPVEVSRTPRIFSWLPRIGASPVHTGDVYVLWQEIVFSGGSHGGEIFFARSHDGGARFEAPINLSNSVPGDGKGRINKEIWHNGSLDLAIGRDGTLYAAWTEYEGPLWFSRSTDRGARFAQPVRIGGDYARPARAPALAAALDNTVFLAWTVGEDRSADIRVARSTDGGRTFAPPAIVAVTKGYSDAPKLAIDSKGTLHLAYAESAGGPFDRYDIRYTRSRDGGRTFEKPRSLSRPTLRDVRSEGFPALSVDGAGRIFVLWETYPDEREPPRGLALVHSLDGGDTFTPPARVPGISDEGFNGSRQGLLMRKLAVNGSRDIAIVNSTFHPGAQSRVWLVRGAMQ